MRKSSSYAKATEDGEFGMRNPPSSRLRRDKCGTDNEYEII